MFDADSLAGILSLLADTSSKSEKEQIVREVTEGSELFKKILVYAYHPAKMYFIKNLTLLDIPMHSGSVVFEESFKLLDMLANREVTGDRAREMVVFHASLLSKPLAEMFLMILNKDLRAGINAKTINKACPGLIPTEPYMRCITQKEAKLDNFNWKIGCISQEKANGMFTKISLSNDGIDMSSRQGQRFDPRQFHLLLLTLTDFFPKNFQYHGEMLVVRDLQVLDRKTGNGVLNHVLSGGTFAPNEVPFYHIWDCVRLEDIKPGGESQIPYKDRLALLRESLPDYAPPHLIDIVETRIVYSFNEAEAHYKEIVARGGEGTIVKDPLAFWVDKTSTLQFKMKPVKEADLRIIGFNPGKGKNAKTFGSVLACTEEGDCVTSVSGFTDKERQFVNANRESFMNTIMAVTYESLITENGEYSLYIPVFAEFRKDKVEADTLEMLLKRE
jgi:DNA ligase-1